MNGLSIDGHEAHYHSIVIGSGPGGLATVCALLDQGVDKIGWVDSKWEGGRLNGMYREISSNTKVGIYLDALGSSPTCQAIVAQADKPNAVTELEGMDKDATVRLSYAGDMIMLLQKGLLGGGKVQKVDGEVQELERESDRWTVKLTNGQNLSSDTAHLCTGSHPRILDLHTSHNPNLFILNLDDVLRKSLIPHLLHLPPSTSPSDFPDSSTPANGATQGGMTIGVIGNSHSGILAIRNLYETFQERSLPLTVLSFERRPILYAEYRDDGIVHDNTGLKGATADWSKEIMESSDPGKGQIKRIQLGKTRESEEKVYAEWLPRCTHLVYAVGYDRNSVPRVVVGGKRVDEEMEFDMHTSGFHFGEGKARAFAGGAEKDFIPRLYGCGIAFPEEVEDPEGNVEAAVGLAKFFKFAERVKTIWTSE